MRILGTEPSSVIFNKLKRIKKKIESDVPKTSRLMFFQNVHAKEAS